MVKVTIKEKEYKVQEAKTPEEKQKGLLGVEKLSEDEGMLFFFDKPTDATFWMKDVLIPLDIIFINEDYEVIYVHSGEPNTEKTVTIPDTLYVLELNTGSGVEVGDEVEIDDGEGPVMKVLDSNGEQLMELWGGERIFRRAFTKLLIEAVKKADSFKSDKERFEAQCKVIGRKIFKEIKAQDTRKPEYVKNPE